MEKYRISILESFPLVSIVMPYYGYTHRMFLVLSELSQKSRCMLISNYKEFRRYMSVYCLGKEICIFQLSKLTLPFDLFKFNVLKNKPYEPEADDVVAFVNILFILF